MTCGIHCAGKVYTMETETDMQSPIVDVEGSSPPQANIIEAEDRWETLEVIEEPKTPQKDQKTPQKDQKARRRPKRYTPSSAPKRKKAKPQAQVHVCYLRIKGLHISKMEVSSGTCSSLVWPCKLFYLMSRMIIERVGLPSIPM